MANAKRLLPKRISVFLCALVLLALSVPCSATSNTDVTGEWVFSESYVAPSWDYLSEAVGGEIQFQVDYVVYTDMYFDTILGYLYYIPENGGNYVTAWTRSGGWVSDEHRYVFFTDATDPFPASVMDWLLDTAYQYTDVNNTVLPQTRVTIGETTFTFTAGATTSPDVWMAIDADGVTFSSGVAEKTWHYSGDGLFTGIAYSADATEPIFSVGQSASMPGGTFATNDYVLYPVSEAIPENAYATSIRVFNNDGTYQRFSYSQTGLDLSPALTLVVTATGLVVQDVDGNALDTFEVDSEPDQAALFRGFSYRRLAQSPTYGIGAMFSVGGLAQNAYIDLYIVYDAGVADPTEADWTSWLATAVSGFLDFEIWPGLSLSNLVLTFIAVGVLFWVLKMTV